MSPRQAWFLLCAIELSWAVLPIKPEQLNDIIFTDDYGISQADMTKEIELLKEKLVSARGAEYLKEITGALHKSAAEIPITTFAGRYKTLEPHQCDFSLNTVGGRVCVLIYDRNEKDDQDDIEYDVSSHKFNDKWIRTQRPHSHQGFGHNEFKSGFTTELEAEKWLKSLGMRLITSEN